MSVAALPDHWKFVEEDIRIETAGQWTRGTSIVDRRSKVVKECTGDIHADVPGDSGGWLDTRRGNRILRCTETPGVDKFAPEFLERVFGDVV